MDREQLLDIQGRSRKRQQALAEAWGYSNYPPSAGGCLLTEEGFSNQLRDLLDHNPQASVADVELLKAGRQFRLSATAKLVLGRNRADNEALQDLAKPDQIRMRCKNFSGPLGIFCGTASAEELQRAAVSSPPTGRARTKRKSRCSATQSRRNSPSMCRRCRGKPRAS